MKGQSGKACLGSTLLLIVFGVLALYNGARWLPVLVLAALLVYHAALPAPSGNRN